MSSDIMTFYVRIVLPVNQIKLLLSLTDLHIRVNQFILEVLKSLQLNSDESFAKELEEFLSTSKFVLCWNRKFPIETKFLNLNSKVEKIGGKEADVFELEFMD